MLDLNKKWSRLDNNNEELEFEEFRIIRPTNDVVTPVECPECASLFRNIEDIDTYKNYKMCSDCYQDNYHKINKNTNNN